MTSSSRTLADLRPNPRNPRRITDAKRQMLRDALARFGDLGGVVYNRRSGQLVGGHQRVVAFASLTEGGVHIDRTLPEPSITGTVAEGYVDMAGERFSYREVDWDPATEKAANIAANKGAGEFDLPGVAEWLADIETTGMDLDLTMFDADERAELLVGSQTKNDDDINGSLDEVPEPPAEPTTRLGDVYRLGAHRLMCGDSTDDRVVSKVFGADRADVTFTSPPYNTGDRSGAKGLDKSFSANKYRGGGDDRSDDEYLHLLVASTACSLRHTDYAFVNLQMLTATRRVITTFQMQMVDHLKDILIWNKNNCAPNITPGAFNTKWEYIFAFANDARTRAFPCEWRGQYPNVVETTNNGSNEHAKEHRAGFPVALPAWFFDKMPWIKSVYDGFAGTGTTLVCAESRGLKCFAVELDPFYCDVIIARWESLTGQKAVRVEGNGKPVESA